MATPFAKAIAAQALSSKGVGNSGAVEVMLNAP